MYLCVILFRICSKCMIIVFNGANSSYLNTSCWCFAAAVDEVKFCMLMVRNMKFVLYFSHNMLNHPHRPIDIYKTKY